MLPILQLPNLEIGSLILRVKLDFNKGSPDHYIPNLLHFEVIIGRGAGGGFLSHWRPVLSVW